MKININENEEIIKRSSRSTAAIVGIWTIGPFATLSVLFSGGFGSIFGLATVLKGFFLTVLTIVGIIWFCCCVYLTKKQWGNELILTDLRIFANDGSKTLEMKHEELVNATVDISFWGKIFKYGNINMQTRRGSITVNNICEPEFWKAKLYEILNG